MDIKEHNLIWVNMKRLRNLLMFSFIVFVNTYQVMFAMRELSGPLSLLIEMMTYCSYCIEPFSLGVLQLLKVTSGKTIACRHIVSNVRSVFKASAHFVSDRPSWRRLHLMNLRTFSRCCRSY